MRTAAKWFLCQKNRKIEEKKTAQRPTPVQKMGGNIELVMTEKEMIMQDNKKECQIPCPIKRQGLLKVLFLDMVKEFAARLTGPDVAITGIVLPVCTTARVPRYRGLRPHRRAID